MVKRILVTGVWHETNTFSAVPTDLAAFEAYQYRVGGEVLSHHEGTNTEIGGMMEQAGRHDFRLLPALSTGAVPSGLVTAEAFAHIVEETCRRAAANAPFDGALVALHGAMCAAGAADADAIYLARLREVLGPGCPVVATFDIHANLSPALFDLAEVLVGYDTYPHVDMAERGREAAAVLARTLEQGERPHKAFRKLPLLTAPQVQATGEPPMRDAIAVLHEAERAPGLWSASLAVGFPYADVPQLGVAVVAYGDHAGAVEGAADRVADAVWSRRHELVPALLPPSAAVAEALDAATGPVVLVDGADNVGGGAPGDGTVLLAELLAAAAAAVVVIWDPQAAAEAAALGERGRFQGPVGGKSDDQHGPPVALDGTIEFAAPVEYRRESTYMTGLPVDLGQVAIVRSGDLRVVLTEQRVMPFDSNHLRVLGIVPEEQKIIVVKSAIAWRAAFGAIAARHIDVDTPGICASNLANFDYTAGGAALFPLDPEARWPR